ncbi:hypothetical protein L914_14844, partial [Phytophthora nicotianae]
LTPTIDPSGNRSYMLANPPTLKEAIDLAAKYDITHFVEDANDRQVHIEIKRHSSGQSHEIRSLSRENVTLTTVGSIQNLTLSASKIVPQETRSIQTDSYAWKREEATQKNKSPRH